MPRKRPPDSNPPAQAQPAPESRRDDPTPAREIERLKQELTSTREYLQAVIEQQDAAHEELQSDNEKLATVNDELQNRNIELARTSDDMVNLLASAQLAIVMLGADLRIRRFTPAAEKLFNLIPADVGRPLSDIKLNLSVEDIGAMVAGVTETMQPREIEVLDRNGRCYLLRVRPYRTLENRIEGVVLVDIDSVKRSEGALRESEERFRVLADSSPPPIRPRRKVLIVDDNRDSSESLRLMFTLAGHDVRMVYEGAAALPEAARFQPDVVLLDIGLPDMDGYKVARALRGQAPSKDALIIAVTGYGRDEDVRRSHDSGIDRHMTKPIDPDVLMEHIARGRATSPAQ